MKPNLLFIVAAAAVIAIYVLMKGQDYSQSAAGAANPPVPAARPALPSWMGIKPEELRDKPVLPPPSSGEILRRFNTAPSVRGFVYEALKKPEQGGYLYAIHALAFCTHQNKPSEARRAGEREALAALAQRCDMSRDEVRALTRQAAADRHANYERDPYLRLVADSLDIQDPAQRRDAVKAMLDTQDPLTMEGLPLFARHGPPGLEKRGTYFGGRYYDSGADHVLFDYAFKLAQCELGIDCGPGALVTVSACVTHGWCAASYKEALRLGTGADFPQLEALAAQIAQAIRQRNVGAFVK